MARRKRKFVEEDHPRHPGKVSGPRGGRFREKGAAVEPRAGTFIGNVPSTHGNARPRLDLQIQGDEWVNRISSSIERSRVRDPDEGTGDSGADQDLTTKQDSRAYAESNYGEMRHTRLVVSVEAAGRYYEGRGGEALREYDYQNWGHNVGDRVNTSEGDGTVVGLYHNDQNEEMVAVNYGEGVEFDWAEDSDTFRGDPSILDWLADDVETVG